LGDRRREGDALRWISRFSWFAGRTDDAVAAAEDALAVLSSLPPGRELAMAMSNRAQLYMHEDENDRAIVWGQQAIALARILGETEIHVHALTNVGNARMRLEHERGRVELEQSLAMAKSADLEEHVARALDNLGRNTLHARELSQSAAYFAEGVSYTTDHDLDSWRLEMLAWRGCLRMLQGDWALAGDDAAAVLESPNPSPVSRVPALTVRGLVCARLGAPDAAESLADAFALAESIGEIQRLRPVRVARAEAAWLAGDAARAVAELRAVLDLTLQRGSSWDIGEVLVWLARLDAPAPFDTLSVLPEPHRLELTGDWAGAAAAWEALGCPYDAALALLDGDEAALRAALTIFVRLGAKPAEAIAAQQLRRIGARGIPRGPRPGTRANPANLTLRELEILPLLVDGLQNGEIADQLFLSVKTVGHHVSSILNKLGVRRRADVAAAAERLGILPPRSREDELVTIKETPSR
jgi:DNA-binding CsgD family transcriptional regulator/tetratricopeptide (TPR) repeat protein